MPVNVERLTREVQVRIEDRSRMAVNRSTILGWAGLTRASRSHIEEILATFAKMGVSVRPDDLSPHHRGRVIISMDPLPSLGIPFGAESQLQDFLLKHWRLLAPFKTWLSVHKGKRLKVPEGGTYVIPDLVGTHRSGITVIELKLHKSDHDAVSQVQRAVKALEFVHADKLGASFSVAGMVISNEPDVPQEQDLKEWGSRTHHDVSWLRYMLRLDLDDLLLEPPASA